MTKGSVSQAVILAGGFGTRLGDMTREIPKPLLVVGSGAFMDVLINELARHGIGDILVSAGYLGAKLQEHYWEWHPRIGLSCSVRVFIEPEPLGTAGALRYLGAELDDEFLLLNGDSWFDLDWLDFLNRPFRPRYLAKLALRQVEDIERYGSVELDGDRLVSFREKGHTGSGLISGGVYHLSRDVLDRIAPGFCSLEHSVLPPLVEESAVGGWAYDGYFIDIGTPDSYLQARREIPEHLSRPAVVFRMQDLAAESRDGCEGDQTRISDNAAEAFRAVRNAGGLVFVLAAPNAPGNVPIVDINTELRPRGAQVDCLVSPGAEESEAQVIASVLDSWCVRRASTLLVGQGREDELLSRQLDVGYVEATTDQLSKVLGTKLAAA